MQAKQPNITTSEYYMKKALSLFIWVTGWPVLTQADVQTPMISIDWEHPIATSKLAPSLYVVNCPLMQPGSPLHGPVTKGLKELGVDYLRYMSYFTFPELSVAELYPPENGKTSWDFSRLDPMVLDAFKATEGHPMIMTFSTVPAWMFEHNAPISYPNIDLRTSMLRGQSLGAKLLDPSGKQLADYYVRLFSWYTKGGFTDELGKFHKSDHHFKIPYWEVFNEPELEMRMSIEQYTKLYDCIVDAIRKVSPDTKFVGISSGLSNPHNFEYFLNPQNHLAGIPLDLISYHGYAVAYATEGPNQWQYSFFRQADSFINTVKFIESIRGRLSPSTGTAINETGTLLIDNGTVNPNPDIPEIYWNASASVFAYLYLNFSKLDIEMLHLSQGLGYPGVFPELSIFNWKSGKPNARYWVLKLLKDNFGPGDMLYQTTLKIDSFITADPIGYQAYRTAAGTRKLLLVNKSNRVLRVILPAAAEDGKTQTVDAESGENMPRISTVRGGAVELNPFAVAVVDFK